MNWTGWSRFNVHLIKNREQSYWKEQVPKFSIEPMTTRNRGWLHSGKFGRGDETLDYVARMDKYLLWVRYKGNPGLISTWQCLILHRHRYPNHNQKEFWSATCPYCCSQVYEFRVYKRSIRCSNCLSLTSRWQRQHKQTHSLRNEIRNGDLTQVSQKLQGSFSEVFQAMLAMELTGLAPRRFSSPRRVKLWNHTKYRSIYR